MDTQQARTRLDAILAELAESESVVHSGGGAETEELTAVDQLPAEDATNIVDADREEASMDVIEAQRERVHEALERIDAGTYGRCVDCGKQIPDERLEARPEAARCIEDQTNYEAAH